MIYIFPVAWREDDLHECPILDMELQCGEKTLDVSLWRDEALTDLYVGDEVVLTSLRSSMHPL